MNKKKDDEKKLYSANATSNVSTKALEFRYFNISKTSHKLN